MNKISTKRLFVKNSFSGVIQLAGTTLLTFITIPIFIKFLGREVYGIFAVISIVGNLNAFTNLGLSTSLIKSIAEQGKNKESDQDIVVSFVLITLSLLPITILAIVFKNFILETLLNIPLPFMHQASGLYIFLLIANMFLFIGQIFTAVIDSQQRIYITNYIQLMYGALYWGLIVLAILFGHSLKTIGLMLLVAAIIWFLMIAASAFLIWGRIDTNGIGRNFIRIAKKQTSYGKLIYTSGLIGFFYEPFTKLMISHLLGFKEAGIFDVTFRIKNSLLGFISRILYPLYPMIAGLSDQSRIRYLVHEFEQKTFFLLPPLIVTIIFCTPSFVTLWLGKDTKLISTGTIWITSAYLIGSLTVYPNYQYLIAKGHAQKTIILHSVNIVFNILIFLATYSWFGYYSFVAAISISILVSFWLSLYYQHKYLQSLIFDSCKQLLNVLIIFGACLLLGFFLKIALSLDWQIIIVIPLSISLLTLVLYLILGVATYDQFVRYLYPMAKRLRIV